MVSSTTNLHNWLAVHHTAGIGPAKFHAYLKDDPTLNELPADIVPNWRGVELDLAWLQQHDNGAIITLLDDRYPLMLKNIDNPPPILYAQGDINCLSKAQIAMVGSRTPTSVGIQQAANFAQHFADLGFVITSGLALGIDGACHKGALAVAGGQTIAVLGHGIDVIYPAQHVELARQVIAHGCLVSEFPVGMQPIAHHFPRRNRIISGLALGVLVVEAALNSGSLITAKCALEQGREVFAIPGSIHNARVKGCHSLIRQGAKLVESAEDIIEELPPLLNCIIRANNAAAVTSNFKSPQLSAQQEQLLNKIDYEATCVDLIVGRTGLATGIVSSVLLELELRGLITAVPGGYARRLG